MGFEPTNNGFAIRPLSPLGYSAGQVGQLSDAAGPVQACDIARADLGPVGRCRVRGNRISRAAFDDLV